METESNRIEKIESFLKKIKELSTRKFTGELTIHFYKGAISNKFMIGEAIPFK
jgi:hypothetical protein